MIVDAILYNGEEDIFELRYNILKDVVDEFVVVEFGESFSGNKKESRGNKTDKFYDPISKWPKVSYHFITEYPDLKSDTPSLFQNEYNQREMIKSCLSHLDDEDTVLMGDCDEIWKPMSWAPHSRVGVMKLKLIPYTYYLNNRSNEYFPLGPIVGLYRAIKDKSLNELRSKTELTDRYLGWHFTNMGGQEKLKYKVKSYSDQQFNVPDVHSYIPLAFEHNVDYLGRPFKLWVDESQLPEEIKNNRDKYKHLLK